MYIALCAAERAREAGGDLAADAESFTEPVFYSKEVLRADVAREVLQTYLPTDIDSIDVGRTVEVREQLRVARLEYAAEIAELTSKFSTDISSETQLRRLKEDLVEMGRHRIEQTTRAYRAARLDVGVKTLGVSLAPPALASWLASTLDLGIVEPVGLGAALLAVGAKLVIDRDVARDCRDSSAWSYVLRVSEGLGRVA